jgi:23S rRNA pseudouridine1911/1915/1917 synthase
VDVFLAAQLPALSRSRVQQLIRGGAVAAAGEPIRKPGALVTEGLEIDVRIPAPAPAGITAEPLPISIVYEDADIAVVDKPAGLVVHPGAGHPSGTLVNALLHHVRDLSGVGGEERPGIVHRLDRGTSGLMVVAKHDGAHRQLARQFQERTVVKEYVALVWGEPALGTIEQPIGRDPVNRKKMSTRARGGRPALTRIVASEPLGGVSLVRLTIGTGRTHQIRVHLSEAGHPVVGDALYGGVRRQVPARVAAAKHLQRPFLHAARLRFAHPTSGREMQFDSPLPAELQQVIGDVSVFHSLAAVGDRSHGPHSR